MPHFAHQMLIQITATLRGGFAMPAARGSTIMTITTMPPRAGVD